MMKSKLLFRGPVLTASGYGVHSRQLLRALLVSGKFDVSVQATNWGQTPFIDPTTSEELRTYARLIDKTSLEQGVQYDISVQCTIPNEFQRLAPVNIGVTAGIEVDRVSPEWIIKANENVDLVIVPSRHSAETYARVQYQSQDGQQLRLQKPIAVCPEGVDVRIFNTAPPDPSLTEKFKFDADFNYLCVGLGLDKGVGEDRKNISTLVKWFCEKFKGEKDVGLVLKVGLVTNSLIDFETTKRKVADIKRSTGCGEFPRIHLIHGRLSDESLAALYKHPKVKALVTLTHGEGFGLPIIEAAACGLPVVATSWSGHLDFLSADGKKKFVGVDSDLVEIPKSAVWKGVMEEGTRWANPKEEDAKIKLKKLTLSYDKPKEWATELASHVANEYSLEKTGQMFVHTLTSFLSQHDGKPETMESAAVKMKKGMALEPGTKTLLYTMPMSAGDVFISTAVIDSLKKKFPDHLIFFGTDPKYNDILKKNPNIFQLIPYQPWMQNVPFCEMVFDEVYTPNLAIQTTAANWVHGGKGRRLGMEIAHQCDVPFGEYFIELDNTGCPWPGEKYIVFHPGSGKGQWEARNYHSWQDVISNVKRLTGREILQVGLPDDPLYDGVTDFRGKTTYNQLAFAIKNANMVIGIDSISMHMAAALGTPHVAIFGSSYANSTGPVFAKSKPIVMSELIDTPNRMGCEKACYKYQCAVDRDNPCVNEITPQRIVKAVMNVLNRDWDTNDFVEHRPKICGYTHILNPASQGFPYIESIKSMLGFCDEVVVVDGGSTDESLAPLNLLQTQEPRLKIYTHEWDWNEPGMDGMQKAYARAMCSAGPNDFLWQQDADEVVHEKDYDKIKKLVKKFPKDVDLIHLPVVELWGHVDNFVRTDRHSWKWRLSRNNFKITHGINKDARVVDEKTGKVYARKGMSDGCEYIDIMSHEFIPHKGFYSKELEFMRQKNPKGYGEAMNKFFADLPSVYHYSWANLPRKIRNFRDFWDKCWSNLYNEPAPVPRFPDVKTEDDVFKKATEIYTRGGEHGQGVTFMLEGSGPEIMNGWLERATDEWRVHDAGRHLRHDQEQARAAQAVAAVSEQHL